MHAVFKISKLALWKKYTVPIKSCYNLKRVFCKSTGVMVKDIDIGAGGFGINYLAGQIEHVVITLKL